MLSRQTVSATASTGEKRWHRVSLRNLFSLLFAACCAAFRAMLLVNIVNVAAGKSKMASSSISKAAPAHGAALGCKSALKNDMSVDGVE
jgi:hypothetical protein